MDFFKTGPELLAKFVTFVLFFARSPGAALQGYGTAQGHAPSVSGELLLFCLLSVLCGTLIMMIGEGLGMAPDPSRIVAVFNRVDPKAQPAGVVFAIIVMSAVWHGLTRAVGVALGRLDPELRFEGAIENSINAGLAVGTLFVLAFSALLVVARLTHPGWLVFLLAVMTFDVAFLVYFVLAFSALHQVEAIRYFALMGATVLSGYAMVSLVAWLRGKRGNTRAHDQHDLVGCPGPSPKIEHPRQCEHLGSRRLPGRAELHRRWGAPIPGACPPRADIRSAGHRGAARGKEAAMRGPARRTWWVSFALLTLLIGLISVPGIAPGQSLKEQIVGAWKIVSIYNEEGGVKTYAYGEKPVGLMVFDRSGYVSQYLAKPDVPKFVAANRLKGTDAEYRGVMQAMLSGFGTYTVDGETVSIT